MEIVLYALVGLLYGGLTFSAFRRVMRVDRLSSVGLISRTEFHVEQFILIIALFCHSFLLHETVFSAEGFRFGFAVAISAMVGLGALVFCVERYFLNLSALAVLIFPAAWIGAVLPLFVGAGSVSAQILTSWSFKLHFLIANMAYGLLALSALHALLMLMMNNHLHPQQRQPLFHSVAWVSHWLELMPPLLTLERLLFRLLTAGFVCLSITVVTGLWYGEQLWGQPLRWNHKTVFTLISWLQLGVLLLGRWYQGWRGRTALRGALASFVMLMLAYVGSRFVLDVILQR